MSYSAEEVAAAKAARDAFRLDADGEVASALGVVGLSADRASMEVRLRDDMIRVAHGAGASVDQLAEVSRLDTETVSAIVGS